MGHVPSLTFNPCLKSCLEVERKKIASNSSCRNNKLGSTNCTGSEEMGAAGAKTAVWIIWVSSTWKYLNLVKLFLGVVSVLADAQFPVSLNNRANYRRKWNWPLEFFGFRMNQRHLKPTLPGKQLRKLCDRGCGRFTSSRGMVRNNPAA